MVPGAPHVTARPHARAHTHRLTFGLAILTSSCRSSASRLFTTEFVGQFAIEGLQPSRTPAFAEPNVFEAFGVVMFTYALGRVSDRVGVARSPHAPLSPPAPPSHRYAFIVTVPSWVNEKKPQVSVKKVMWTSALTCSLLQLAFGLLGAWAFDLVGPKATCTKSDCQNILLIFDHPDMPVTTRPRSRPAL